MPQRTSPSRRRHLARLGENISAWRTLQGLSASELARRAHVTRDTLRALEEGTGTPKLESVMAVIAALGFADAFVSSADPLRSEAGRALALDRKTAR